MIVDEPMLFPPTLSAFQVSAHYEVPHGWRLVVAWRYEHQQTWPAQQRASYERLSTGELADVMSSELERLGVAT